MKAHTLEVTEISETESGVTVTLASGVGTEFRYPERVTVWLDDPRLTVRFTSRKQVPWSIGEEVSFARLDALLDVARGEA